MEISLTLTVLLLQFPSVIYAGNIQIHTLRGGSVELVGEVSDVPVESVEWRWNKNKAVEWEKGDQEPLYYSMFQYKSKLNMVTWALNISDLQPGFTGQYTLLINEKLTAKSFQLVVLEPVSEPKITEDCSSGICILTCQGIDSIYTKYIWTDNQGKTKTGSVWRVEKSERLDVVYTCNFSNPVSWKTTSINETELFPASLGDCTTISSNDRNLVSPKVDIQVLTSRNASVELIGDIPNVAVNSAVWTWNKLKIASWKKGDEIFYSPTFRHTAKLNTDTWALTMSGLQPTFNGQYALEINHMETKKSFQLVVLVGDLTFALESGSVELVGEVPLGNVVSVLWQWENLELAEWDQGEEKPNYYLTSEHAVKLNMQNWALTISNLRNSSDGTYRLLINGVETKTKFHIIVLESVSRPFICKQCTSTNCTLTCTGVRNILYTVKGMDPMEHTKYTWSDNKGRTHPGSVLKVEMSNRLDVIYTCNFSNPISWNTNSISERELFPSAKNHSAIVTVGSIFVALISVLVIVGIFCFCRRKRMNGKWQTHKQNRIMLKTTCYNQKSLTKDMVL